MQYEYRFLTVPATATAEEIETNLNDLATEGWEIVTVTHPTVESSFFSFVLRRPRQ
jgi:hypothetical protein